MTIENRLEQAGTDATRVADSFVAPGIQHGLGLRWRRRVAAGIAVSFILIGIAVAGVWGMADLISNETPPADTGPGPELQWTRVSSPPPVENVRDIWANDDGFALWTGAEVWTSPDGQTWQLAVTTPDGVGSFDTSHAVEYYDGTWIGVDSSAEAPSVWINDSGEWTEISLPYVFEPANALLTATMRSIAIASNDTGVVVVGRALMLPDPDAVMARFAPEIAQAGGTATLNTDRMTVDISDGGGTVVATVPFEQIDERYSRVGAAATVIWHSANGTDWDQVGTFEQYAAFPDADRTGFVIVASNPFQVSEVWSSDDGVDWKSTPVSDPRPVSTSFAHYNGQIIVTGPDGLIAIDRNGNTKVISTGGAFTDLDPSLTFGEVNAGGYGITAWAYDSSTGSTPVRALWYSPDGTRWSRQELADVFGAQSNAFGGLGTIKVAVDSTEVLVGYDPGSSAGSPLGSDYQLWLGSLP